MGRVMKLQFFIWAILGVALLITETGTAQVSEKDAQRALRGLTSIYLLVDELMKKPKAVELPSHLSEMPSCSRPVCQKLRFPMTQSSLVLNFT